MARNASEADGASSRLGSRRKRGWLTSLLIRLSVWGGIVVAGAAGLGLSGWGLYQVLFLRNPHFLLRRVNITVNGRLRPSEVEAVLSDLHLAPGDTNLFAVDLAAVRLHLEDSVLIKQADVVRRLPGTLDVQAYERQPVAQLAKPGGRLVDIEGWVLPERDDPDLAELPVIVGIRSSAQLQPGARIADEMIEAALRLLRLLATEPYGKVLDVAVVQLDYGTNAMQVHVRERGTFRPQAKVVLPVKGLHEALQRVEVIALDRLRGRQTTSFVDATYEVNIPVRP